MSEIPDALHHNLANGRQYPFRQLPNNEMMLMTDRRLLQFLTRVLAALDPDQAKKASWDSDLSPIHFYDITQDLRRQWTDYSEYERPWEYNVFPALRESIVARWEECIRTNSDNSTSLTGEEVAGIINTVILRQFNVPMEGIKTLAMVTWGNPEFQTLRDHFSHTVAPYTPTVEYHSIVYGNIWQSIIADCMHRRDGTSLWHILTEGKKQAPEALSDAIAHMVMSISWYRTCVERFDQEEVELLVGCMPYMIFSKKNTAVAISNMLRYRKIHDEYGFYDTALSLLIRNAELQTRDMCFGYEIETWSFEDVAELINRLTAWGVPASYIISPVFHSLIHCREDVWEKLDTLLPPDMSEYDQNVWSAFQNIRNRTD